MATPTLPRATNESNSNAKTLAGEREPSAGRTVELTNSKMEVYLYNLTRIHLTINQINSIIIHSFGCSYSFSYPVLLPARIISSLTKRFQRQRGVIKVKSDSSNSSLCIFISISVLPHTKSAMAWQNQRNGEWLLVCQLTFQVTLLAIATNYWKTRQTVRDVCVGTVMGERKCYFEGYKFLIILLKTQRKNCILDDRGRLLLIRL